MDSGGPAWDEDVRQADWIAGRLAPWGRDSLSVTAVVPGGFESYARLLHPATGNPATGNLAAGSTAAGHRAGGRIVRWAEVAAWSGLPLYRRAQFHSVALPPFPRPAPPPFSQGPGVGTLDLADALVLAGILRRWTATPDDCWFCVWDGFGWHSFNRMVAFSTAAAEPPGTVPPGTVPPGPPTDPMPAPVPDPMPAPVPDPVPDGPRVRLPNRDYLLYRGPAEAVTATAGLSGHGQTANLWWPADRAWCVATEIDLQCSYVGGPAALIGELCADGGIEALPALGDDPVTLVLEDWVTGWVDGLTDTLLSGEEATLSTALGTVRARLRRPAGPGDWHLDTETAAGDDSRSGSSGRVRPGDEAEVRRQVACTLTHAILALTQG